MRAAPTRRWFRWSLRTMFVVVTIFGCWLSWQFNIVHERKSLRHLIEDRPGTHGGGFYSGIVGKYISHAPYKPIVHREGDWMLDQPEFPWWRKMLGDEPVGTIYLPFEATSEELARVVVAFPEARVCGWQKLPATH